MTSSEAGDDDVDFRMIPAGADGYLLKRIVTADLRAALLDVAMGVTPMAWNTERNRT